MREIESELGKAITGFEEEIKKIKRKPGKKKKTKPPQNVEVVPQNVEVSRHQRRVIRHLNDLKSSELKQLADILLIKTPVPRITTQREELMRKIRRIIR